MNERFEEIVAKAKKIDQLVRSGEREKETFQKQQCVDNCRTILSEMDRALSELERENMNESQDNLPMDSFAEDDLSELLSSLQQILEDIKANDTIYTILELLREDYGDL